MPLNQQIKRIILNATILIAASSSPLLAAEPPEAAKPPCDQPVADLQHKAPGELTG